MIQQPRIPAAAYCGGGSMCGVGSDGHSRTMQLLVPHAPLLFRGFQLPFFCDLVLAPGQCGGFCRTMQHPGTLLPALYAKAELWRSLGLPCSLASFCGDDLP